MSVLAKSAGHEPAFDVVTKERMIAVSVAGLDGDVDGACNRPSRCCLRRGPAGDGPGAHRGRRIFRSRDGGASFVQLPAWSEVWSVQHLFYSRRAMLLSYERSAQPGLVGAGLIVPVASVDGS